MRVGEIGIPMLVVILKYRILYDLDRPLGKIRQVIKKTLISSSYEKFKEIFKQLELFSESPQKPKS